MALVIWLLGPCAAIVGVCAVQWSVDGWWWPPCGWVLLPLFTHILAGVLTLACLLEDPRFRRSLSGWLAIGYWLVVLASLLLGIGCASGVDALQAVAEPSWLVLEAMVLTLAVAMPLASLVLR